MQCSAFGQQGGGAAQKARWQWRGRTWCVCCSRLNERQRPGQERQEEDKKAVCAGAAGWLPAAGTTRSSGFVPARGGCQLPWHVQAMRCHLALAPQHVAPSGHPRQPLPTKPRPAQTQSPAHRPRTGVWWARRRRRLARQGPPRTAPKSRGRGAAGGHQACLTAGACSAPAAPAPQTHWQHPAAVVRSRGVALTADAAAWRPLLTAIGRASFAL